MRCIKLLLLLLLGFLVFSTSSKSFASPPQDLPVITVINMIRGNALGREHSDLLPRLQSQWEDTKNHNIAATWLWQYDALKNEKLTSYAKSELKNQEFGLFLEVDKNFAQDSIVLYRGRGPWYFSDGLFTFSYDLPERNRLIDTLFSQFRSVFGYYPKTVGAWWVDADALSYMQQKYGITSALRAADQYDLDVYSIWGTPWGVPYLSSIENAGIPANSFDQSSQVVVMQWAPRDPLKAYGNKSENGTFSLQDYELKKYDQKYFNYLAAMYLKKPQDQIVVGLENDGDEETFIVGGHYNNLLRAVSVLVSEKKAKVMLTKDYADTFLKNKSVFSPTNYFLSKDFEGENQAFWYNGSHYRIGIQKKGTEISVIDLRDYRIKTQEDFSVLPNSQGMLRIYVPPLIDSAAFPERKKLLLSSHQPLSIKEELGQIVLLSGDKKIGVFNDRSFTLSNSSVSLPTISQNGYVLPFSLSLIFCMAYIIAMRKRIAKRDQIILATIYLIALFFAGDFQFTKDTIMFDKKMIIFSVLFPLIPVFSAKIYLSFFVVPFLLFLAAHAYITIRYPLRKFLIIFPSLMLISTYAHVPYFPLDKTTYIETAVGLALVFAIIFLVAVAIYLKTKNKKTLIVTLFGMPFALAIVVGVIFLSRTRLIIPPFETQALKVVEERKKNVWYLYPSQKPIYKATKPALLDNYYVEEKLTGVNWTTFLRNGEKLDVVDYQNKLLVVPRFLGSNVSDQEVEKLGLKKIFDNSQIAIFE
ncbi:MAG: hypothetical protein HZC02_00490 [Candidatus Levybacteria bacterium]|nr:hypothetical protein [Candidatus Levybacteria bacterium]